MYKHKKCSCLYTLDDFSKIITYKGINYVLRIFHPSGASIIDEINEMINKPYFTPIPNDNTLNLVDIDSIHSMINNGNYFDKNFNSYNLIIYIEDSWRGYIYKSSDDTLTITIGTTPNYKDFWISIENLSLTETDLSRDYHILHLLKKC